MSQDQNKYFKVKIECVNSININNVKYKYCYNKKRFKASLINSIYILMLIASFVMTIYFSYNFVSRI